MFVNGTSWGWTVWIEDDTCWIDCIKRKGQYTLHSSSDWSSWYSPCNWMKDVVTRWYYPGQTWTAAAARAARLWIDCWETSIEPSQQDWSNREVNKREGEKRLALRAVSWPEKQQNKISLPLSPSLVFGLVLPFRRYNHSQIPPPTGTRGSTTLPWPSLPTTNS